MEEILQHIQEVLGVPAFLINHCTFLPQYIKESLIASINFIPWLYVLYYGIELLERFFLTHINFLIRLIQKLGPLFGVTISVIPECGYQVIASTFYSRKMISRGTLLAFYISCSDDALPLLFMDLHKAFVIIPIVVIKIIVGVFVAYSVDIIAAIFHRKKQIMEDINAINTDLYEPACCHHRIHTKENPPYWWMHPLTHTFNMFMFTFLSLAFINCAIQSFGSVDNLANYIGINTPYQLIGTAFFGLISNCVTSVVLAVAYVKGIISFPALLSGLVSTTGLGLLTLAKRQQKSADNILISVILVVVAILVGLAVYYNMYVVDSIKDYFIH